MSLLASALIRKIGTSCDLRYNLSWSYGGFIEDIPRRIGTNEALDTAVAALVSAHSHFSSNSGSLTLVESLTKYSHALKALRRYLDNPVRARQSETLCGVMLLLICQSFLSTHVGNRSSHGEGMAQILKARAYYDRNDKFEATLLLALRGPVLFEALVNSKISFTPKEWRMIVENELDEDTPAALMMRCLANVPNLIQRGRKALREQSGLQMLVSETRCQYQRLTAILRDLHDHLEAAQELSYNCHSETSLTMVHAHHQRMYGLGLIICIIFNCILRALAGSNSGFDTDLDHFCENVLSLAVQAVIYRPLGAGYVTLCLTVAWCGCRDEATRFKIERALDDYRMDITALSAETFKADLEYASRRLSLLEP